MIQSSGVNREVNSSRLRAKSDAWLKKWTVISRHSTLMHKWTQRDLAACITISHFQAWQAPSTDKEMDMRSNPKKETICNSYSQWVNVVSLGISTTLLSPMPRSKWPTETELTGFFFYLSVGGVCVYLLLRFDTYFFLMVFCLFILIFCIYWEIFLFCVFFFAFERERT